MNEVTEHSAARMLSFLIVFTLFTMGHALGWFTFNSQLVWDYWREKSTLACIVFGVPGSLCFWWGTKIGYEDIKELWSLRLTAYAASYMVFPVLTWWFLKESMFTTKTILCIILSMIIVLIQAFWRTNG